MTMSRGSVYTSESCESVEPEGFQTIGLSSGKWKNESESSTPFWKL
jgi:hypothetical protein